MTFKQFKHFGKATIEVKDDNFCANYVILTREFWEGILKFKYKAAKRRAKLNARIKEFNQKAPQLKQAQEYITLLERKLSGLQHELMTLKRMQLNKELK